MPTIGCAHCGLPVAAQGGGHHPAYCCVGCSIMAAALGSATTPAASNIAVVRSLILRLGLGAFFASDVMVLSLFLYSLEAPGAETPPAQVLALIRWLTLLFATPAFALLFPPYAKGLARDVRHLRFSMDGLIALGAGAAFLFSTASVIRGSGQIYFDTACMVLLLVTTGRLLEAHARRRGRRAVRELMELAPSTARIRREDAWQIVDASTVTPGDVIQVLAGERIPVDGAIERGASAIDESMLTGEPVPAGRSPGEAVSSGSLVVDGAIEVRCTHPANASMVARIISTVEHALEHRSHIERLADRAAAWFVPAAMALACVVVIAWWGRGAERAWMAGLSVLVVACPCALGIAVPLAYTIAIGAAARNGILVRSGEALERLAHIDTMAFDKTGTLTEGRLRVTAVLPVEPFDERALLSLAAAAAQDSLHPVSRAIARHASEAGVTLPARDEVTVLAGRGVEVVLAGGRRVTLGQPDWVESAAGQAPASWRARIESTAAASNGVVYCATDGKLAGAVLLEDSIAHDAAAAVAACAGLGLGTVLLSGDRREAVAYVASSIGIRNYEGGMTPEDKAARIQAMQRNGRTVAMAGDGINDATALAAADVGIAVAGGTDVAREVAEVVLLDPGLHRLAWLVELARRARRVAIRNLVWTAAYNAIALAAAAAGWLTPVLAAALMVVSSLFVIGSSLRLPVSIKNP
jgi:heavy metal translocating P-type ATPase